MRAFALLLLLGSTGMGAEELPKFMAHQVTMAVPEPDAECFPKGPATVCVEFVPQRQCYTALKDYVINPTVEAVQLNKNTPALFFSAETYGVSGWQIRFALLRPGMGRDLDDIFLSDTSVPNQSQHSFWTEPAISDAQIFVTAGYVWGPDEGHYGQHRYIISAYVRRSLLGLDDSSYYYLEDQYMTFHKYDLDAKADVLASEKPEILARLRRVKAATAPLEKSRAPAPPR